MTHGRLRANAGNFRGSYRHRDRIWAEGRSSYGRQFFVSPVRCVLCNRMYWGKRRSGKVRLCVECALEHDQPALTLAYQPFKYLTPKQLIDIESRLKRDGVTSYRVDPKTI